MCKVGYGHRTERRDQDRHEREDNDDVQDAPLIGIVGFDFLLDILRPGKNRTVARNMFEDRFDRIVGLVLSPRILTRIFHGYISAMSSVCHSIADWGLSSADPI